MFVKTRNAQVPMGKLSDSFDVASATAFLCSENARYITGHEFVVEE